MAVKVGIPRALLYYYYFPMWRTFFESLGAEPVVSPATTKTILEKGLSKTVDEACLPVKLAVGHVIDLAPKVDFLFLPRLVSIAPREYICPKFMGFPCMVRQTLPGLPPVIDTCVNMYSPKNSLYKVFSEVGRHFTRNPLTVYRAWRRAEQVSGQYMARLESGQLPWEAMRDLEGANSPADAPMEKGLKVAVIGHPYNIYDPYISMNVIKRLTNQGVKVLTPEGIPDGTVRHRAAALPKKLFWTMGQRMIGAAFHYMHDLKVDGIIHVASFGCGPDSMTGELIERYSRRVGTVPFLNLTLDEHTGEAGVVTRLEAFLDMVSWRGGKSGAVVSG